MDEAQHRRRDWQRYQLLTFLFAFGFAAYSGVFQNFLRDDLHAGPVSLGLLESTREIPGLLAALMAGTLVALAEARIASIGLIITAIGIGLSGATHQLSSLTAITVFWSIGFHIYATVSSAITLRIANGVDGGKHLGKLTSVSSIATLVALGLATVLSLVGKPPYWVYFAVGGVSILASGILGLGLSDHASGGERKPIIIRKRYALYYLLTFLEGSRRQIFSIFASFALVLVYKVPVEVMLAVQFVNAILISLTAPAMGRWIDQQGEKRPLAWYSFALIVVFFGYALIQNVYALIGLFLIDNILFTFNVGFTTYLHRIVLPGEMTPCLAMGVTMSHVAAVTVPIGGALLWERYHNYQIPFWLGVALAFVGLIANRWLPDGRHHVEPEPLYPERL